MMTISSQLQNAVRYLVQAEELRAIAIQNPDRHKRELLLNAADACEQMAHWQVPGTAIPAGT